MCEKKKVKYLNISVHCNYIPKRNVFKPDSIIRKSASRHFYCNKRTFFFLLYLSLLLWHKALHSRRRVLITWTGAECSGHTGRPGRRWQEQPMDRMGQWQEACGQCHQSHWHLFLGAVAEGLGPHLCSSSPKSQLNFSSSHRANQSAFRKRSI